MSGGGGGVGGGVVVVAAVTFFFQHTVGTGSRSLRYWQKTGYHPAAPVRFAVVASGLPSVRKRSPEPAHLIMDTPSSEAVSTVLPSAEKVPAARDQTVCSNSRATTRRRCKRSSSLNGLCNGLSVDRSHSCRVAFSFLAKAFKYAYVTW